VKMCLASPVGKVISIYQMNSDASDAGAQSAWSRGALCRPRERRRH
jgi:hypothetical protein